MMQGTLSKNRLKQIAFFILCVIGFINPLQAQKKDSIGELLSTIAGKIDSSKTRTSNSIPGLTGNAHCDSVILNKYMEVSLYHMRHEINAYEFQYFTSVVIFIMVIAIVTLGLLLSYKQFTLNERLLSESRERAEAYKLLAKDKPVAEGEPTEPVFTNSSLEFGKDGVKINTAVIGLMILAISLAFFFLYLQVVYKIDIQK